MDTHDDKMEDVKFQTTIYPLSVDRRIEQNDEFRRANTALIRALTEINNKWAAEAGDTDDFEHAHSDRYDCTQCSARNEQIRIAYRDYYLSDRKVSWQSGLGEYQDTVKKLLEDGTDLDTIRVYVEAELRQHLRQDLTTPKDTDSNVESSEKDRISRLFDSKADLKHILSSHLDAVLEVLPGDQAQFIMKLQDTETPSDRGPIYVDYYCRPSSSDDSDQRKLKTDFTRTFMQAESSHDDALREMRAEAENQQAQKISKLQRDLADLQSALSAHLKSKEKKAEKDKIMRDMNSRPSEIVSCSFDGCPNEVDIFSDDGPIECVICKWLAKKDSNGADSRRRYYYCSPEHGKDDFEKHDHTAHVCVMGNHCFYNPLPGPPSDSQAGGICIDCSTVGSVSYFCSSICYESNLSAHRESHESKRAGNTSTSLELVNSEGDIN